MAEALAAGLRLEAVFVEEGHEDAVPRSVHAAGLPLHLVAPGVVASVATTVTPQPVLAVAGTFDVPLSALAGSTFVVVLAGVADPGNLGTILRAAEAAGAEGVVLTEGSVDLYNPKVVRASAGALGRVPVVVEASLASLRGLGLPLLGLAATGGVSLHDAPLSTPVALVLGSEAHGLPAELTLDGLVSIEHVGRAESLNVAMAAAIACFEVVRQRRADASAPPK